MIDKHPNIVTVEKVFKNYILNKQKNLKGLCLVRTYAQKVLFGFDNGTCR